MLAMVRASFEGMMLMLISLGVTRWVCVETQDNEAKVAGLVAR
jgi:hypothetical protein